MNEQHQDQEAGATSANPRAEWVRPELYSFEAGSAEAGDISNPDGNINS